MSRCSPFPPSGYEKNGLCGEDLVEWIKRERERVMTERQKTRKERKRAAKKSSKDEKEKCEGCLGNGKNELSHENICAVEMNKIYHDDELRKKATKERKRTTKKSSKDGKEKCRGSLGNGKNELSDEKICPVENSKVNHDDKLVAKVKDGEIEQSDDSDMTEEHERSHNGQMAYESSDNTQNSKKRKLQNPLTDGSMDCLEQPSRGEHSCSQFEEIELFTEIVHRQEQLCSTSGRIDIGFLDDAELAPESRSSLMELQLQFEELIKTCAASQLQLEQTYFDDLEWLFDINQYPREEAKRPKLCSEEVVSCSSSQWPRANYIPQFDMYVMPYTIPY